jgi:omega-6 fatty acid desaturase (delta-12 desaturase)
MRKGKELILATRDFAKEIRWKSWFYTLTTLFVLIACNAVAFLHIPFLIKIPFAILNGCIMVRMFVIYHDHQHHTILQKSKLADAIFTIFGIYILAPTSIWKRSHDYHHNHNSKIFTASIGSYPVLSKDRFLSSPRDEQKAYLFVRNPLTISFGYIIMFMYGMCVQSFLSSKERHKDSLLALILHAMLIALVTIFFGWKILLVAVLIPFLVSGALGSYLFYAQHNFPGVSFEEKDGWTYEGAALESSSYMKMNFFWRWVSANIGFHHVHHLNARIPFYRLPEAMAKIPELQHPKITTLNPSDIVKCLRLKVWDSATQKMISLKGIQIN